MNEVQYVSDATNGFGAMIELNGTRLEVRREYMGSQRTWRRTVRYGVQVAPQYNLSGLESVWGRNVKSLMKKLRNDKRKLVG